jgi:phage shock protein PspC (stress-responsive transcriptional regulator)
MRQPYPALAARFGGEWSYVMAIAGSIIARDDTVLGVCFALGQDFGFNPLYLRLLFAVFLFWSPAAAFGGYAVLGAIVAFSRWVAPDPLPAATEASECGDDECEELRLAA